MPLKKRINDIVGIVKISRRVVASVKSCFEALYIVRLKFVIAVENFPVNGAGLAYVLFSSVPPSILNMLTPASARRFAV